MAYAHYIFQRSIDFDAPCYACQYNLRGLSWRGACPECGVSIADSLERIELSWQNNAGSMVHCDPAWVRTMLDGVALLLAACAIVLFLGASLQPWCALHLERTEMLVLACVALVLEWYGVWKLTTRDALSMPSHARLLARAGATVYMILMLSVRSLERAHEVTIVLIVLPIIVISICGGGAFWLQVRRLAVMTGARTLPVYATFLIVLVPLWFLIEMLPELGHPNDSLSLVTGRASVPFGSADRILHTPEVYGSGSVHGSILVSASVPLLCLLGLAHLFVRIAIVRRQQKRLAA